LLRNYETGARHLKRIDSQLARETEFALPIELNEAKGIQLAREFFNGKNFKPFTL
jgi:hypothetical protein